MYTAPGFVDMEDSNGDVAGGSWRDEQRAQGLEPVRSVGSNRYSLFHHLRGKSVGSIVMLIALVRLLYDLLFCVSYKFLILK